MGCRLSRGVVHHPSQTSRFANPARKGIVGIAEHKERIESETLVYKTRAVMSSKAKSENKKI